MDNNIEHVTTGSVFDDLFEPDEAANLKVRTKFMNHLIDFIEKEELSQKEAAERLKTSQPRISALLNGKISKFTIDALLNMCTAAGIEVDVTFRGAYAGSREVS